MNDEMLFKVILAQLIINAAREYIYTHVKITRGRSRRVGKSMLHRCWVWQGCGDGRYGHAYFMGKRYKAHRLAYMAFVGPIRRNRVIDHQGCNNPACCNPFHLRAVTQSANIKRAHMAGRVRPPRKIGPHIIAVDDMGAVQ